MLSFLYDLILLLIGLISLPKILFEYLFYGKHRSSFLQRLGRKLVEAPPSSKPVIWFHMVSVGETKAMGPLYEALKEKYPEASFYFSSTTHTGHQEAKRTLKEGLGYFFLPFDFSFIMKKVVAFLKPDILILSESDFWYHLLKYTKEQGGKILLCNGKISQTSLNRFLKFPWFSKKLFGYFDKLCVQSFEHYERFTLLPIAKEKIAVTGNLKLAGRGSKLPLDVKKSWKERLNLQEEDLVLTIGSTHHLEEKQLIEALAPLRQEYPLLKLLIVPRHPERFSTVKKYLKELADPRIILVDQMGVLSICYQLSFAAIVGGSFVEGIGGHNIFEPLQAGIPVFFGPHMEGQKELKEIVLRGGAGMCLKAEDLREALLQFLKDPLPLQKKVLSLTKEMQGAEFSTLQLISPFFSDLEKTYARVLS